LVDQGHEGRDSARYDAGHAELLRSELSLPSLQVKRFLDEQRLRLSCLQSEKCASSQKLASKMKPFEGNGDNIRKIIIEIFCLEPHAHLLGLSL